jgi:hypothetical protein
MKHTINGINGTLTFQAGEDGNHKSQVWVSNSRKISGYGKGAILTVELRYDDECQNGHNSFSVTGSVEAGSMALAGGCLHEDIAEVFPELKPFIKFHLWDYRGPMHYVANTLFLASDKDCFGYRKGEPCAWDNHIRFGDFPVTTKVSPALARFLRNVSKGSPDLDLVRVPASSERFTDQWTFAGFEARWGSAPFKSELEANQFVEALRKFPISLEQVATKYSEGKPRNFKAAREVACWPDATDEQLSLPGDELKKLLEARWPLLMEEFNEMLRSTGFNI